MKANFIRKLCEAEMNKTEVALCVGSIGDQLQSMIEKLSNIKIKDVEELDKKIKYSGDIEGGESFNQSIGEKLDQAIQSLTSIKGDIDNQVVEISQGGEFGGSQGGEQADLNGDFANDFGDEGFDEFNPDEENGESLEGDDELNFDDDMGEEITRESK